MESVTTSKKELDARLIEYNRQIESGKIDEIDIATMLKDYLYTSAAHYKTHGSKISNKTILKENLIKLKRNLIKLRPQLAEYFNCEPEEICCGDVDFRDKTKQPYTIIWGDASFVCSKITDLSKLQSIAGRAFFSYSQIKDLGNLQSIGLRANFDYSQITSLGDLQSIGGRAIFCHSQITDLGNLQSIGGDAYFYNSKITDFGKLQSIGGSVYFRDNKELEELFYSQFEKDGDGWKRKLTAKVEDGLSV